MFLLGGTVVDVEGEGALPAVGMVTTVVVTQVGWNDGKSVTVSQTMVVENEHPTEVGQSVEDFAEETVLVVVTYTVDGGCDKE